MSSSTTPLPLAGSSKGRIPLTPVSTTSQTNIPTNGISSAPATTSAFSISPLTPEVTAIKDGRKLCVRHKQMANQNVNAKLQKSLDNLPLTERAAITNLWSTFSSAPHGKRKLILEGILTMCCFSQLSHLSDSLNQIIRIDPFSLLPREVSLRVLGFLDAMSLGKAAQVSKSWKALADDDLLWRRMCGQHIDRKCEKCGWGLPLLERRRLKVELKDRSPAAAVGVGGHDEHAHGGKGHAGPSRVVTRVEALGGKGPDLGTVDHVHNGVSGSRECDPAAVNGPVVSAKRSAPSSPVLMTKKRKTNGSDSESEVSVVAENGSLTREIRLTRPWKTVYCERLLVERNWRKGRCNTKTLKGHSDGIMCLQYHTTLTSPSYPVLITGSYDRTVRVWNLDTGLEVRCLQGHTRAVRTLQFDQMLLFTGSMDGTVRMWNWRAGECLKVLEGHTDGVISLNYNGYLLASGSADSTIQVWNFRTGGKFVLRGHEEWVNNVVIWDGKTNPGDMDPTVMPSFMKRSKAGPTSFPSFSNTAEVTSLNEDGQPAQPDIEPGTMLFSSSDDGTIKMWDLVTQTCVKTFTGHKGQVQSLKVLMVDMSEEEIMAAQRGDREATPTNGSSSISTINRATNSPPGGSYGHLITNGHHHTHGIPITPALLSPSITHTPGFDPHALILQSRDQPIQPRVYVHSDEEEVARHRGTTPVTAGGMTGTTRHSEDGQRKHAVLVSGSLDGTIKLWDVESGREKGTLFGHIEGVWAVDIDALRVASASHDRTIKVWDREAGTCVQTLVGHRGAVTSLQLSDDMIISGSDDGDVMVWSFAPAPSV